MDNFLRTSKAHLLLDELSDTVNIDGDAYHHLARVMRISSGDVITAAHDGYVRAYEIENITRENMIAVARDESQSIQEPDVHLCVGLFHLARLEVGVAKAIEAGATSIQLYASERSSVTLPQEKREKTLSRMRTIARSAAMQSRRAREVTVDYHETLFDILDDSVNVVIAEPSGSAEIPQAPVRIVIGPEGGFSPEELEQFSRNSIPSWSISPYILRSETAMITAAALVAYSG